MRQRPCLQPNFGGGGGSGGGAAAVVDNGSSLVNSRLNLESKFSGDGDLEDGGGGGGGGDGRAGRQAAKKGGAKPPTSLSVDVTKSKTPRGDCRLVNPYTPWVKFKFRLI